MHSTPIACQLTDTQSAHVLYSTILTADEARWRMVNAGYGIRALVFHARKAVAIFESGDCHTSPQQSDCGTD